MQPSLTIFSLVLLQLLVVSGRVLSPSNLELAARSPFPQTSTPNNGALDLPPGPPPHAYEIDDGCNRRQKQQLTYIIDKARATVLAAYKNAKGPGPPPFTKPDFFETFIGARGRYKSQVISLLSQVYLFDNVAGRRPSRLRAKPPEFICVALTTTRDHPDVKNIDPWNTCETRTDNWAFGSKLFRYIFICPRFWDHEVEKPFGQSRVRTCPHLTGPNHNSFVDDHGVRLIGWQKYLIVHELLHMYLPEGGLARRTDPKEVYGLNECVHLPRGRDRISNPNNIEYFVALIFEECVDNVDPYLDPFHRAPTQRTEEPLTLNAGTDNPGTLRLAGPGNGTMETIPNPGAEAEADGTTDFAIYNTTSAANDGGDIDVIWKLYDDSPTPMWVATEGNGTAPDSTDVAPVEVSR